MKAAQFLIVELVAVAMFDSSETGFPHTCLMMCFVLSLTHFAILAYFLVQIAQHYNGAGFYAHTVFHVLPFKISVRFAFIPNKLR